MIARSPFVLAVLSVSGLTALWVSAISCEADELVGLGSISSAPTLGPCGVAPGGFVLQGSETCLRIDGRIKAEFGAGFQAPHRFTGVPGLTPPKPVASGAASLITRAMPSVQGRISVDARTETEFGPVRSFVSIGTRRRGLLEKQ